MSYGGNPAYIRSQMGICRPISSSLSLGFAIVGLLALITGKLLSGQTSGSKATKVPIAIYGTFFDEDDNYPADLAVVAHCTSTQAPILLEAHTQTSKGKPKEVYFLPGHFKDGTCTLIYSTGNKVILNIPHVPIRSSRTSAVAVLMHKAPSRPTLFIALQELQYYDKPRDGS